MMYFRTRAKAEKGSNKTTVFLVLLLLASSVIRVATNAGEVLASQPDNTESLQSETTTVGTAKPAPEQLEGMLKAFARREKRIADQEAYIEERMSILKDAEVKIAEQLKAMRLAETQLRETLAYASTAAEDDLSRLTAVYENMKPKVTAALFEQMNPEFAAGFVGRMRPDIAAAVMTGMKPESAYSISAILAGRNANAPKE